MTDDLAADLVAKLMEDEEKQDKQWYYRDPQGQVQGSFFFYNYTSTRIQPVENSLGAQPDESAQLKTFL